MTTPSLPMVLFAVADAIARGGMPEPAEVRVNGDRDLVLDFDADETAARRWAKAAKIDTTDRYQWSTQPYTGAAGSGIEGRHFTLHNAYGKWQGVQIRITALVPVEEPAAVTS